MRFSALRITPYEEGTHPPNSRSARATTGLAIYTACEVSRLSSRRDHLRATAHDNDEQTRLAVRMKDTVNRMASSGRDIVRVDEADGLQSLGRHLDELGRDYADAALRLQSLLARDPTTTAEERATLLACGGFGLVLTAGATWLVARAALRRGGRPLDFTRPRRRAAGW